MISSVTRVFTRYLSALSPALGRRVDGLEGPDAHDAVVGAGQEEDVLLLKAKASRDDDEDEDIDSEEEADEGAKVGGAEGEGAGPEEEARRVDREDLEQLQIK